MKIHIVQKGDTLWNISKKYGVNFEELKKMNAQLSNPEMIMPGMKIKVPTSGGSVKKESIIPKKEMPKAVHPYAQQQTPTIPVQKEMPKKEMPKKEMPIQKEAPKKEMPIQKEPIYTPKMPQPIVPEIDINNYYLTNMTQMQTQPQYIPPAPPPPPPPKKEKPESIEMYKMPVQEECYDMYPYPHVMPAYNDCGCGGGTPYPYPYPQQSWQAVPMMPQVQGMMIDPMTQSAEHGTWMYQMEESSSSSSSMPMMGHHMLKQPYAGHQIEEYPHVQPEYHAYPQQNIQYQQFVAPQGFSGISDGQSYDQHYQQPHGYQQGHPQQGYAPQRYVQQGYVPQEYAQHAPQEYAQHAPQEYTQQGYAPQEYVQQGYGQYNSPSYPVQGWNSAPASYSGAPQYGQVPAYNPYGQQYRSSYGQPFQGGYSPGVYQNQQEEDED
ncbi:SafA/ExsA family spore coat assembly protein [Heyndrickxia acidicola]|uniref:SafA/ExsA family spore coat assembly protein n=1 Tax=Heyndrickxia acidicola TaxID=209389 RepID=A0ABU6MLD1_9BACI|nr:SafA/ExsA family spore coat assembly protein [Heyndrickxia acidicola]MED1204771.1 SafA/ExsA family spore coat assembly protein [Heyndrickxia acidicola]